MTSRIEEFRNRLTAISGAYVSQSLAAMATLERDMAALATEFEADIKADKELYGPAAESCLKVMVLKLKEAGLA